MLEQRPMPLLLDTSRFSVSDLVDRLVEHRHDVEAIQDVNRTWRLLFDHLQIGLPHVAANKANVGRAFFSQHAEKPQKRLGRPILANPQQALATLVDLAYQSQELVPLL